MAKLTITKADGVQTVTGAALAADTDFQVIEGTVQMSTEADIDGDNPGFKFCAGSPRDSWFCAAGKTVRVLTTTSRAVISYENLA